ncbi:hypothetical protein EMIHUDRAFT_208749 [Emiliania huxleyi CCMP1516]|uniref:Uncharacterized protein n=2 Tax=Emiliania huxleyi TaxID=2903 RepID=A0A0D3J910_EMIH1|nr:hypothetical protein EMIHUDRAFT_208749 [Emiliania huxleyi CCMP1516]EOD19995.1 hypothetical protein EMIHUDRAFT_208749 [Emiliania huxleyi CCMP1516]|eukprot:XP_005772424.1 hypothetical protein EMIHUDRAFT_208749 [Emiliania huxleyi CCMP1516]
MAIPLMPSGTGGSGRLCWYRDEAVRTAAVYEDIRGGDCGAPPPPRPEADAAQVQEVQRRKEALAAVAEASRKAAHKRKAALDDLKLSAARARQAASNLARTHTREQQQAAAWHERTHPAARPANPAKQRCPRCAALLPRQLRSCPGCLHDWAADAAAEASKRRLVWRKSPAGTNHRQSVAPKR